MSDGLRLLDPLPATLRTLSDAEYDQLVDQAIIRQPNLSPREGGRLEDGTFYVNSRCKTCNGDGTFKFWNREAYGEEVVTYMCPCIDQWILGALFGAADIPESLGRLGRKDVEIPVGAADLIQPWLNDVQGYSHRGEVLILQGDHQTGKTFLATLIMRAFLSEGYSALRISANDIRSMKIEGFDHPEQKANFHRRVVNTDLLVIDELGSSVEGATDFLADTLREVVVKRHGDERPTILISPKEPAFISSLRSLENMLSIFPVLPLSEAKMNKRREEENKEIAMKIRRPLVLR